MPETLRLSHFDANLSNGRAEDDEEECDCSFPWWWLILAAAAGGGLGYYAGHAGQQKKIDELEAAQDFDDF